VLFDVLDHVTQFLAAAHCGAEQLILSVEEAAQIEIDIISGRRTENDDAPTFFQYVEGTVERCTTDAVDDEVDRLAFEFLDPIAVGRNGDVSADLFCLGKFVFTS